MFIDVDHAELRGILRRGARRGRIVTASRPAALGWRGPLRRSVPLASNGTGTVRHSREGGWRLSQLNMAPVHRCRTRG